MTGEDLDVGIGVLLCIAVIWLLVALAALGSENTLPSEGHQPALEIVEVRKVR